MNDAFYEKIQTILVSARNKVYQTANFAMVEAYWQIGRSIVSEQGGADRAEYGTRLLNELSRRMTRDFGKGFTVTNLKYMRQFYLTFPNGHALRDELSWTHYRLLMRVNNDRARQFYLEEAVKSQWSTRQLERQISSFFYERLLSSKDKAGVSQEIQRLEPARRPEDTPVFWHYQRHRASSPARFRCGSVPSAAAVRTSRSAISSCSSRSLSRASRAASSSSVS